MPNFVTICSSKNACVTWKWMDRHEKVISGTHSCTSQLKKWKEFKTTEYFMIEEKVCSRIMLQCIKSIVEIVCYH